MIVLNNQERHDSKVVVECLHSTNFIGVYKVLRGGYEVFKVIIGVLRGGYAV